MVQYKHSMEKSVSKMEILQMSISETFFYLHVCDLINIYVNRRRGMPANVYISTNSLTEISCDIIDELTIVLLTGEALQTFNYQCDVFY
jgi:restriction endonuclease Mrr